MENGEPKPLGTTWPVYSVRFSEGSAAELEADNEQSLGIIVATVIHGDMYNSAELQATKQNRERSKDKSVRGGKQALVTYTDDGWSAVQWSERRGLAFAVSGFNVTEQELTDVVESLEEN